MRSYLHLKLSAVTLCASLCCWSLPQAIRYFRWRVKTLVKQRIRLVTAYRKTQGGSCVPFRSTIAPPFSPLWSHADKTAASSRNYISGAMSLRWQVGMAGFLLMKVLSPLPPPKVQRMWHSGFENNSRIKIQIYWHTMKPASSRDKQECNKQLPLCLREISFTCWQHCPKPLLLYRPNKHEGVSKSFRNESKTK
jgi:hypothetical protein